MKPWALEMIIMTLNCWIIPIFSYLAANGPDELKSDYFAAPTNEEDAFTFAVDRHVF